MRRNNITKTDAMECQFYVTDTILTIGMFRVIADRSNLALLVFEEKSAKSFFHIQIRTPFFSRNKKTFTFIVEYRCLLRFGNVARKAL